MRAFRTPILITGKAGALRGCGGRASARLAPPTARHPAPLKLPLTPPAELRANLEEVLPKLQAEKVHCLYLGRSSPTPGVGALGAALAAAPSDPVPADLRADIKLRSPALFIYTSGTTGERARCPGPTSELSC